MAYEGLSKLLFQIPKTSGGIEMQSYITCVRDARLNIEIARNSIEASP
jgi:hypothetical protein